MAEDLDQRWRTLRTELTLQLDALERNWPVSDDHIHSIERFRRTISDFDRLLCIRNLQASRETNGVDVTPTGP